MHKDDVDKTKKALDDAAKGKSDIYIEIEKMIYQKAGDFAADRRTRKNEREFNYLFSAK